MRSIQSHCFRSILVSLLTFLAGAISFLPVQAGETEIGIQFGALAAEDSVTLDSTEIEPLAGLRGSCRFGDFWGLTLDTWLSELDYGGQDMPTIAVRTSVERVFGAPEKRGRFFLSVGGGLVNFEPENLDGVNRTFASLGFGQSIVLKEQTRFRWELRGDHTLDDDGFAEEDITLPQLIFGLSWSIGGRVDADGDGVRDHRDDCPDTPLRAIVDKSGCPLDTDADGVYDGDDRCPDTPQGEPVDPTGCLLDRDDDDSDGDGVENSIDACPDTPLGATADARGCPSDSDADEVPDGIDDCPDTPLWARVGSRGCPSDEDGDGVLDGPDDCPHTPPGIEVDASGCTAAPPSKAEPEIQRPLVLEDVFFGWNSAALTGGTHTLDAVARLLVDDWPEIRVEIGGHTDSSGTPVFNQWLAERRATAVRDYLIGKGVAADRVTTRSYGASQPRDDNATRFGRARNRRVEMKRID